MSYVLCNKVSTLKVDDGYLSLFDLCAMILERIPKEGITIQEMKLDLSMSDKFYDRKENEEVEFSAEEIERLKILLNATKFPFRHKAFIEFSDFIMNLK
ncbi:MAG: hypothetical protein RR578_01475 [Bacilli bacterium]